MTHNVDTGRYDPLRLHLVAMIKQGLPLRHCLDASICLDDPWHNLNLKKRRELRKSTLPAGKVGA